KAFDESQLGPAGGDRLRHLSRVADRDADFDLRIGFLKPDQVLRQPVAANRLAGMELDHPAPDPGTIEESELSLLGASQDGGRFLKEELSILGDFDMPADTVKQ